MTPKVTVLMPLYNTAAYLEEAIQSILSQTYTDFEFIIINDGSTDNSKQIVEKFQDSRIRIINNEQNIGIIATRNKGLHMAKGEYIANMDSDDISLPDRIDKQVKYLDSHPDVAVIATKLVTINENGCEIGYWHEDNICTTIPQINKTLPVINCIGQPTAMMRKEIIKSIGYNHFYLHNEDWGLWLDLLVARQTIAKLDEVLLKYRIHSTSTTVVANKKGVAVKILNFKFLYLKQNVKKGFGFNSVYMKILFSFKMELIKFVLRPFYKGLKLFLRYLFTTQLRNLKRILTYCPFKTIKEYNKLNKIIQNNTSRICFVFPYTHVGGAEKVHSEIINSFKDEKPLVIFSGFSDNDKFLKLFLAPAQKIVVPRAMNHPFTKKSVLKKLAAHLNNQTNPVLFGANAMSFFELIPYLNARVKVVELVHAFKFKPGENTFQKNRISLYYRMDTRIFISNEAKKEMEKFYKFNNVSDKIASRLTYIPNCVNIAESSAIKFTKLPLKILFVGRNSKEKRIELIIDLARKCNLLFCGKIHFTIVGFNQQSQFKLPENVAVIGEIIDSEVLETIYKANDILMITSEREGFPMVIMEAMANGLAILSTPVGDIPNHISVKTGFLVSSNEPLQVVEEMFLIIEKILNNLSALDEIKNNNIEYAKMHFSRQSFNNNYKKVINTNMN
jgi:glycosyltransferase involved in cell wall biosynthesis